MEDDIALKIEQAFKEDDKKKINYDHLRITRGTFEKIMTYAKVVSRMAGSGMECYGYLLSPRDSLDGLITDAFFAREQEARAAYVRVTEEGVFHTLREVEALGYKIFGWWHSHGTIPVFHSGTDVENFKTVLHTIAPLTMHRNEEAVYALNTQEKRLEFDNYVVTGVNIEQLKQIKIIKKLQQDPFAFSLVVNQFGDYYRERITKTLDGREFTLNHPTHPQVEIIEVEDDVKFSIDEIEKDVFFKIKINGRNARDVFAEFNNKTSDVGKMYSNLIKRFIDSSLEYLKSNTENNGLVTAILNADPRPLLEVIKNPCEQELEKTESVKNPSRGNLQGIFDSQKWAFNYRCRAAGYLTHLPGIEARLIEYFNKKRLNINTGLTYTLGREQFETLYLLRFMKNFSDSSDKKTALEKLSSNLENLESAFSQALQITRVLTNYSSETFTDYYKIHNHKYRSFVTKVLNKLCTDKHVLISQAILEQVKYNTKEEKEFFLYDDRRQIANQILMAKMNYPASEPEDIMKFLDDFAQTYHRDPQKCDEIIENQLFRSINVEDFSKYQDLKIVQRRKQVGGKIYGTFFRRGA